MPTESDFQQAIVADPNDVMRWLLWADWLEENGASDQTEIIRLRSELTSTIAVPNRELKEARLRELVCEQQVSPPVVMMTTSIGMVLHLIPPGEFLMGSPQLEKGRRYNEAQVSVTLTRGFWMGKYQVTQAEYEAVMGNNPSYRKTSPQHPVEHVSYHDAVEFCRRLTESEHAAAKLPNSWKFTLPTEAQWENACRAGSSTAYSFGDDASQLVEYAWYRENSNDQTHPVGQKRVNSWNIDDMHGNVWEWCLDWYDDKLAGGSDPRGPATGSNRVFRDGGPYSAARFVRSAFRSRDRPESYYEILGFRVVLVPTSESDAEIDRAESDTSSTKQG